jgi:hypothetical protein
MSVFCDVYVTVIGCNLDNSLYLDLVIYVARVEFARMNKEELSSERPEPHNTQERMIPSQCVTPVCCV